MKKPTDMKENKTKETYEKPVSEISNIDGEQPILTASDFGDGGYFG